MRGLRGRLFNDGRAVNRGRRSRCNVRGSGRAVRGANPWDAARGGLHNRPVLPGRGVSCGGRNVGVGSCAVCRRLNRSRRATRPAQRTPRRDSPQRRSARRQRRRPCVSARDWLWMGRGALSLADRCFLYRGAANPMSPLSNRLAQWVGCLRAVDEMRRVTRPAPRDARAAGPASRHSRRLGPGRRQAAWAPAHRREGSARRLKQTP